MRNLKRALSLALASVMLLGMMVVGTSAASYTDVDEKDNVEAIEVLNAVNVMIGRQGNFEPDEPVNRHEMAVIMAKLVLGVETADNYVGSHPYTDVVPWADKYVAACYENGLTSGTSATTYGGSAPLTAVQAAAMMLRALGYEDLSKGATDWRAPVTAAANRIRLFDGVASNPSQKLNRNQVAQLALNTLKSPVVDTKEGLSVTGSNGDYTFTIDGNREYIARSSNQAFARAIDSTEWQGTSASSIGGWTIELGEHLYNGKLKLDTNAKDKFGRPSNNWQYDGKDIGTYVNNDLKVAEYTEEVTGADLYDLLTYTTINDNDLLTWIDGVDSNVSKNALVRSNKNGVNGSDNGVLTEVFVDLDHKEVTISAINTYLAKANSDYNKTNETLSLKVYETGVSGTTKTVDVKDVPAAANVAKDDFVLVYMSGWDTTANRLEVVDIFDVEIMSQSAVTKFTKDTGAKVLDKLTTGGQEYKTNPMAFYDNGAVLYEYDEALLTDMTYNIYMDRYNNVIGVDLYEGTKNYVFITGYDRNGSNIAVNTATAAGIFTDGTMDTITVNVTDTNKNIDRYNTKYAFTGADLVNSYFQQWESGAKDGVRDLNRWYTYTVSNSGVYTLKPVERSFYSSYEDNNPVADPVAPTEISDTNPVILNSANLYVDDDRSESYANPKVDRARAYGNDNTIYITVSAGDVDKKDKPSDAITDVDGVYTGAQNVKLELTPSHKAMINNKKANSEEDAYVYAVYDGKYYIEAAIVIGEAQGAKANYAYILSDAKNERIEREGDGKAAGDVTYYWEFDAVVDGVKTTLTAKSKYASVFNADDVEKYTVRELRYDGEYVVGVKAPDVSDYHNSNTTEVGLDKADIYDVGNVINGSYVDSPASDIAPVTDRLAGTIELVGRTLYVNPGPTKGVGLALASDAKAVLVQPENGKRTVTNCDSVSEALGRLADRKTDVDGIQFKGRVVAILKDGVAQWVVIISDTNLQTGTNPDYDNATGQKVLFDNGMSKIIVRTSGMVNSDVQDIIGQFDKDTGEVTIYLPKKLTKAVSAELQAAFDAVYSDVTVTVNGTSPKAMTLVGETQNGAYFICKLENVSIDTTGDNLVEVLVKAVSSTSKPEEPTPPAENAEKIADFTITVPSLAKGDKLSEKKASTANTNVTVDTVWAPSDTEAKAGTKYTATITVTVKDTTKYTLEGTKITVGTTTSTVTKANAAKWSTTADVTVPADGSGDTGEIKVPGLGGSGTTRNYGWYNSSETATVPSTTDLTAAADALKAELNANNGTPLTGDAVIKSVQLVESATPGTYMAIITTEGGTEASGSRTTTVKMNRYWKVNIDGNLVGYVTAVAEAHSVDAPKGVAKYLLNEDITSVAVASSDKFINVTATSISLGSNAVTEDINLYSAVLVKTTTDLGETKVASGDKTGLAAPNYVIDTNGYVVKAGANVSVTGKALGTNDAKKFAYVTANDKKVGSEGAVGQKPADMQYQVLVANADDNGEIELDQLVGYKFMFNGKDLGIVDGTKVATVDFAPDGTSYHGAQLVVMGTKSAIAKGTSDVAGVTYTGSTESAAAKYTIALGATAQSGVFTAADTANVNGVVTLVQVAEVQIATGAKVKFTVGTGDAAESFAADTNTWVAKGTTIKVESVGAAASDDGRVLKAQVTPITGTEGSATAITGGTAVKDGTSVTQAKADYPIGATDKIVKLTLAAA